jgi:hypothetical protein
MVWLTQKAMTGFFGIKASVISKHLANIFETGKLEKESTISIWKRFNKKNTG